MQAISDLHRFFRTGQLSFAVFVNAYENGQSQTYFYKLPAISAAKAEAEAIKLAEADHPQAEILLADAYPL